MAGKCYFDFFAYAVNTSFNYTPLNCCASIKLSSTHQKLFDFEDSMNLFYLNLLKFHKLGGFPSYVQVSPSMSVGQHFLNIFFTEFANFFPKAKKCLGRALSEVIPRLAVLR